MYAYIVSLLSWKWLLGAAETQDLWEIVQIFSAFQQFFLAIGIILMFMLIIVLFLPPARGLFNRLTGSL